MTVCKSISKSARSTFSRTAILGVSLLALSACALQPYSKAPELTSPAGWTAQTGAVGEWPDASWWQGFGSAELNRLMVEAEAGNLDLADTLLSIRQAEAQQRAAGSALLPTIGASFAPGRSWNPDRGTASTSLSTALQVGYELDLFGAVSADIDAARTVLEASVYNREAVKLSLQATFANSYFQLLALRDRIRLSEQTLAIVEDVLGLLDTQVRVGAASDLELVQQRSAVASQRASLEALRQTERESLNAIAVLLGRMPQGFAVEGRSLSDLRLPPVTAGLPSELLRRRPDIRQSEAELKTALSDEQIARAARFPSLSLTGRANIQASNLGDILNPAGLVASVAASLTAPIFQGGRLEAAEDVAIVRSEQRINAYRRSVLTAFQDTENALSATAAAATREGYTRTAQTQAEEALRIVNERFRAGTVPFLNVLDAQRTLFQANDATVQATLTRHTALVSLYKALGGGWTGTLDAAAIAAAAQSNVAARGSSVSSSSP